MAPWRGILGLVSFLGLYYVFMLHYSLNAQQQTPAHHDSEFINYAPASTSVVSLKLPPASMPQGDTPWKAEEERPTAQVSAPPAAANKAASQYHGKFSLVSSSPVVPRVKKEKGFVAPKKESPSASLPLPSPQSYHWNDTNSPYFNHVWSGMYACYDYGETFAASFLADVSAFVGMRKYRSVLKSHRAAHACHYITWTRQPLKTVDVLDFFVEHLSAYERRLNLGKMSSNGGLQESMKLGVAKGLSSRLGSYAAHHFESKAARLNYLDPIARAQDSLDSENIIGLIPYYGEGMGKGQAQSSLSTRKAYIEATFWSIRAVTSRVVVAVCTDADATFIEALVEQVFAPQLKRRRDADGLTNRQSALGVGSNDGVGPGFPVLTLLRVDLQGPQSLPVAAVSFLVRTANREGPPAQQWSYEALPRRPSRGTSTIPEPVTNWNRHIADAKVCLGAHLYLSHVKTCMADFSRVLIFRLH